MTHTFWSFRRLLLGLYLIGVIVLAIQPIRTVLQSDYQGILFKGGDESQYIMRIQEAMHHPLQDVSNAIVSGDDAPRGLQMTLPEATAGTLFGWMGMSAPVLGVLLSVLLAPLLMPLFAMLSRRFGVSERSSFIGAVLIFFLLLGPMRRVVHQSWSLPYVTFMMIVLIDWFRARTLPRSLTLGVLLGLLPGIYFWAWTYVWASFGLLAVTLFLETPSSDRMKILTQILSVGVTALIVASPFLVLIVMNSANPNAVDAGFRSSLIHAREFESLPRSVLFILLAIGAYFSLWKHKHSQPIVLFIGALLIVLHQQFIHGQVLSYWTHYYPYVCVLALLLLLVYTTTKSANRVIISATSLVSILFLAGALTDYFGRAAVFTTMPHYASVQHLAAPIQYINQEPGKQTVLTDPVTSLVLGTYTTADLVYTPFLRHTLISFSELAERYCLVEYMKGGIPDTRFLADDVRELSAAGREGTQTVFERDLALTKQACDSVYADPSAALKKYHVTLVLWDEKNHSDWHVPSSFEPLSRGAEWSIRSAIR
jgi:hypothetical protein